MMFLLLQRATFMMTYEDERNEVTPLLWAVWKTHSIFCESVDDRQMFLFLYRMTGTAKRVRTRENLAFSNSVSNDFASFTIWSVGLEEKLESSRGELLKLAWITKYLWLSPLDDFQG
jgi:hypothetical protein